MDSTSDTQWNRFFEVLEDLETVPGSRIGEEVEARAAREDPRVASLVRLHFRLPSEPGHALFPGARLCDRYTIIEELGRGGMGVVYRASQDRVEREVALKIIHPQLTAPRMLDRFSREIKTLGRLEHANLVRIYDADVDQPGPDGNGIVFFSMQLVEGERLHHFIRNRQPAFAEVLQILIKCCRAVQFAHEHQTIHRDLKPGNILVTEDGEPVILDFGLATLAGKLAAEDGRDLTGLSGTPAYMAPEQFLGTVGEFGEGQSIDLYALGVIAFEMLTGAAPYNFPDHVSWAERRRIVLEEPPRHLTEFLDPEEFAELDLVIRKCLRKDPADRYFTVAGLIKALTRIEEGLSDDHRPVEIAWEPAAGARIPGTEWVLERHLGVGGVGEVWLANHDTLKEQRVFKFCPDEDKVRYLKREASLFRLLKEKVGQHPHFVRLHDVSLDDRPYYLAMDFVEGEDLATWCERAGGIERVPLPTRLEVVAQAAATLQAAHDAGILHRDLKPGNLLIQGKGTKPEDVHVYVADFGIGQLLDDDPGQSPGATRLGFTRTVVHPGSADSPGGTHLYMAPELLSGATASVRSDIYSLGVVLFQAIVGNFSRALTVDWYDHIEDPLLEEDLKLCFSGDPADRLSSPQQLADRLRNLDQRQREEEERRQEARALERRAYRRGILRTGIIALILIGAFAFLAWLSYQRSRESWRNESALRLEQVRALRQSNLPERSRHILNRIAEAEGEFPAHLVSPMRNEALAALSVPLPPFGETSTPQLSLPEDAPSNFCNDRLVWSAERTIHLGHFADGVFETREELESPDEITAVDCSEDGSEVCTLSTGGVLRVYSSLSGMAVLHSGCGQGAVAINSKGLIAAPGPGGQVLLFQRVEDVYQLRERLGQKPPTLATATTAEIGAAPIVASSELLEFSPDGRFLAVGSNNSLNVLVWDTEQARLLARCPHRHYPSALAWDRSIGGKLWTASADGGIYGWEGFDQFGAASQASPTVEHTPSYDDPAIRTLDSSPSGLYLTAVGADGSRRIHWTESLLLEELRADAGNSWAGYLSDGSLWAARDGRIEISPDTNRLVRAWKIGRDPFLRLTQSPDHRLLAGTSGGNVIISDASSLATYAQLDAKGRTVAVGFSGSKSVVSSTGAQGLHQWAWETTGDTAIFKKSGRNPNFGLGGEYLSLRINDRKFALFTSGNRLRMIDYAPPRPKVIPHTLPGTISALAHGRGTDWLALASRSSSTRVVRLLQDEPFSDYRELPPTDNDVLALACSPDGRWLIERTDTLLRVTDTSSWEQGPTISIGLPPPESLSSSVSLGPVAIAPDNNTIATIREDASVVLYERSSQTLLAQWRLPGSGIPTALLFTEGHALVIGTSDGTLWWLNLPAMRRELHALGLDWHPPQEPPQGPDPLLPVYPLVAPQ